MKTSSVSLSLFLAFSPVFILANTSESPYCLKSSAPTAKSIQQASQVLKTFKITDEEELKDLSALCHLYRLPVGESVQNNSNWIPTGEAYFVEIPTNDDNGNSDIQLRTSAHQLSSIISRNIVDKVPTKEIDFFEKVKIVCPNNKVFITNISKLTEEQQQGNYEDQDDVAYLNIGSNRDEILKFIGDNLDPFIYAGLPDIPVKGGYVLDKQKFEAFLKEYQPVLISRSGMVKDINDFGLYMSTCEKTDIKDPDINILSFHCHWDGQRSGGILAFRKILKNTDGSEYLGQFAKDPKSGKIIVAGHYVSHTYRDDHSEEMDMNFHLALTDKDLTEYVLPTVKNPNE